jgi:predicted secreted protein
LYVNTGSESSPSYTVLGGQRGATVGRKGDEIDASSKDSAAHRVLPGRVTVTITCDALYIPSDAAYQALDAAQKARDFIMVQQSVNGVPTREARAIITDLSEAHPDMDVSTVSVGLSIDGDWDELLS